jgi:hypothetical protein
MGDQFFAKTLFTQDSTNIIYAGTHFSNETRTHEPVFEKTKTLHGLDSRGTVIDR